MQEIRHGHDGTHAGMQLHIQEVELGYLSGYHLGEAVGNAARNGLAFVKLCVWPDI